MKRKLIDERGRIFGLVSVIDILAILVVIVLAFAVYTRFFSREQTAISVENDTFTYELRVNGVRTWTVDAFQEGDRLYNSENGVYLGQVTGVSYEPAVQEARLTDGTYVLAPVEDRYDMLLTIEVDGLVNGERYFASRTYELNVNARVSIITKYCATTGTVWSIG